MMCNFACLKAMPASVAVTKQQTDVQAATTTYLQLEIWDENKVSGL